MIKTSCLRKSEPWFDTESKKGRAAKLLRLSQNSTWYLLKVLVCAKSTKKRAARGKKAR